MLDPLACNIKNRASYIQFKTCSDSYIQFNRTILHKRDDPLPWKHWEVGSSAFTSLLNSHMKTRWSTLVRLTLIVLTRLTVLVLFTSMELFGTKEMFLSFEYNDRKAHFLSKSEVLLSEKHCARPSFSLRWHFLRRDRVQIPIHLKQVILQNGDVPATLKHER
jgi:hypothetical protein